MTVFTIKAKPTKNSGLINFLMYLFHCIPGTTLQFRSQSQMKIQVKNKQMMEALPLHWLGLGHVLLAINAPENFIDIGLSRNT